MVNWNNLGILMSGLERVSDPKKTVESLIRASASPGHAGKAADNRLAKLVAVIEEMTEANSRNPV